MNEQEQREKLLQRLGGRRPTTQMIKDGIDCPNLIETPITDRAVIAGMGAQNGLPQMCAADSMRKLERELTKERERCALICEQVGREIGECPELAQYCADAIRDSLRLDG